MRHLPLPAPKSPTLRPGSSFHGSKWLIDEISVTVRYSEGVFSFVVGRVLNDSCFTAIVIVTVLMRYSYNLFYNLKSANLKDAD